VDLHFLLGDRRAHANNWPQGQDGSTQAREKVFLASLFKLLFAIRMLSPMLPLPAHCLEGRRNPF
jgi:hypothetical protein